MKGFIFIVITMVLISFGVGCQPAEVDQREITTHDMAVMVVLEMILQEKQDSEIIKFIERNEKVLRSDKADMTCLIFGEIGDYLLVKDVEDGFISILSK